MQIINYVASLLKIIFVKKNRVMGRIRSCRFPRFLMVRVNECPAGLEPSAGARNRRKVTEKYEETATSDSSFDKKIFLILIWNLLTIQRN